jgi:hypothetical protein
VCEYWPAGNVEGDSNQFFIDNVKPQIKGMANDTVESGVQNTTKNVASSARDLAWGGVVLGMAGVVVVGLGV